MGCAAVLILATALVVGNSLFFVVQEVSTLAILPDKRQLTFENAYQGFTGYIAEVYAPFERLLDDLWPLLDDREAAGMVASALEYPRYGGKPVFTQRPRMDEHLITWEEHSPAMEDDGQADEAMRVLTRAVLDTQALTLWMEKSFTRPDGAYARLTYGAAILRDGTVVAQCCWSSELAGGTLYDSAAFQCMLNAQKGTYSALLGTLSVPDVRLPDVDMLAQGTIERRTFEEFADLTVFIQVADGKASVVLP